MRSLSTPLRRAKSTMAQQFAALPRGARPTSHRARLHQRLRMDAAWNAELCADDHRLLTNHERTWRAAHFAGYRAVGDLLYEHKCCPRCNVTISRPTRFIDALSQLLAELQSPLQPSQIVTSSASLLLSWAGSNLPPHLGVTSLPDQRAQVDPLIPGDEREDWQQFGSDLRQRREAAGQALPPHRAGARRARSAGRLKPRGLTRRRPAAVPRSGGC